MSGRFSQPSAIISVSALEESVAPLDTESFKAFPDPVTTMFKASSGGLADVPSPPVSVQEMAAPNPESLPKLQGNEQPFRLMDLPAEIRNMIFKEFLVMKGPILFLSYINITSDYNVDNVHNPGAFVHLDSGDTTRPDDFDDRSISKKKMQIQREYLNLFPVSDTIYRETVPIYFGLNTFSFSSLEYLETFISKLRPDYRWALARVEVNYWGPRPAAPVKSLLSCPGLRELTLHLVSGSVAPPRKPISDASQCQLFGMKDLLKVRGLTKLVLKEPSRQYFYHGNPPHLDLIDLKAACQRIVNALEERLQVLKKPIDPKVLRKLEKKDFPGRK